MANGPSKYNNLGYFNLARGIGIVLILAGHSMVPFMTLDTSARAGLFSGAGSVIGGGVMAMLFLISGFGFYTRTPKKCLQTQTRLLLYPYYQVAALLVMVRLALTILRGRSLSAVLPDLLLTLPIGLNAENSSALFGAPVKSVTILWFILALFGGWVIYNRIYRVKDTRKQNLLLLFCVVSGWALTLVSKAWPMCLPMALTACGYLAAGNTIKRKNLLVEKLPVKAWLFMAVICLISLAYGTVDIGAGIWKLGLIDLAATFCLGFLLLRLYARFMKLELQNRFLQTLERIGNRSIWIVFFHAIEKSLLPWYRLRTLIPYPWLSMLVCFTARSLLIWAAYRSLTYLSRMLRRRRKQKYIIEA